MTQTHLSLEGQINTIVEYASSAIGDDKRTQMRLLITNLIERIRSEVCKAFGACQKCYGKGYATQIENWGGSDEWSGKEFSDAAPYYRACSCDRGRQVTQMLDTVTSGKRKYE